MNKVLLIPLLLMIFYSCKGKKDSPGPVTTDTLTETGKPKDTVNIKIDTHYYWEAVPDDESSKLVMKRIRPIPADSLTAGNLIQHINSRYDHIILQLVKISNDTVFVKIRQSNFLTQQMGSTGADTYITEVTYLLSELNNIGYVNFTFKEGDHASPGTYSRTDFTNIKFSSH